MTNKFSKTEPIYIHKRIINNNAIEMFRHKLHGSYKMFRHKLHEVTRCFVTSYTKVTGQKLKHQEVQMCFIKFFIKKVLKNLSLYDEYFPMKIIKLKT